MNLGQSKYIEVSDYKSAPKQAKIEIIIAVSGSVHELWLRMGHNKMMIERGTEMDIWWKKLKVERFFRDQKHWNKYYKSLAELISVTKSL